MHLNCDKMSEGMLPRENGVPEYAYKAMPNCTEHRMKHDALSSVIAPDRLHLGMRQPSRLNNPHGVPTVVADLFRLGLTDLGEAGQGTAQKPNRLMPDSSCNARRLRRQCPKLMTHRPNMHHHVPPVDGRAIAAQQCPDALCKAICRDESWSGRSNHRQANRGGIS